jgi:hypothetical protein
MDFFLLDEPAQTPGMFDIVKCIVIGKINQVDVFGQGRQFLDHRFGTPDEVLATEQFPARTKIAAERAAPACQDHGGSISVLIAVSLSVMTGQMAGGKRKSIQVNGKWSRLGKKESSFLPESDIVDGPDIPTFLQDPDVRFKSQVCHPQKNSVHNRQVEIRGKESGMMAAHCCNDFAVKLFDLSHHFLGRVGVASVACQTHNPGPERFQFFGQAPVNPHIQDFDVMFPHGG